MGTSRADRFRRAAASAVLVAGTFAFAACVAAPADPVVETSGPAPGEESEFERDVRTTFDDYE